MTQMLLAEITKLKEENEELRKGIFPKDYVVLCVHCATELKIFEDCDDGMEVSTTKPSELEQSMEMERKDDNLDKRG
jgi:hypothetical protein